MAKYRVYAIYGASKMLGEFEAETQEEAISMAENSEDTHTGLCHHCAGEIDLNDDPHKFDVETVDD